MACFLVRRGGGHFFEVLARIRHPVKVGLFRGGRRLRGNWKKGVERLLNDQRFDTGWIRR